MVKKKPDKFARDVDTLIHESYPRMGEEMSITRRDAVKLLRQYHKEVQDLVRGSLVTVSQCPTKEYCNGYNAAMSILFERLKELAK